MNALCYKVIFSKRLGALVAVGENATSQGKSASGAACRTVVAPTAISTSSTYSNYVGALKSLFVASTLACVNASPSWAAPDANALPTNGVVQTGAATVSTNGAAMTINQATQKASINWNSFSIGKDASVNVVQNNASSVLLNRVVGNDPSQIFGKLTANGQVILINPNGIVFGKGGSVTASAFTASTFGMSDADFQNGKYKYTRNGSTAGVTVENGADIHTTTPGGYVALIGASVNNQGEIHTQQGAVVMASGESVALPTALTDSVGVPLSSKVRLELAPSTLNASVENGGTITTEGGQVLMHASAVVDAVWHVANACVTHTGTIDTTGEQGGRVDILADHGTVRVSGTVKANSTNGTAGGSVFIGRDEDTNTLAAVGDASGARIESKGGFVETSGEFLKINGARVIAKDWLLDPNNITIAASNPTGTAFADTDSSIPDTQYTPSMTSTILAGDIAEALADGTSVTISTAGSGGDFGDITVNSGADIIKTTSGTASLTLRADRNITVNAKIGAGNSADGLNINLLAGKTTQTGTININSNIYAKNGDVVIQTQGGRILSSNAGAISGKNITLDNTGGSLDDKGQFTRGEKVGTSQGVYITGSVNAAGALNIAGATNGAGAAGVQLQGGSEHQMTEGKSVNIYGSSSSQQGVFLINAKVKATGGDLKVTGVSDSSNGLRFSNNINNSLDATAGNVNITAESASGTAIDLVAGHVQASSGSEPKGGDIIITADSLSLGATVKANDGTGAVTVKNKNAVNIDIGSADVLSGDSKTLGLNQAELNKISAKQTIIGSSTTRKITVSRAITTKEDTGHITLHSGDVIDFQASLTVGGSEAKKILTLNAGGDVTQANTAIKAAELQLLGANANYKLNNTSNSVGTIAGTAKKIEYTNAGALTIGTVKGVTETSQGIQTTAGLNVTTQKGNLTINQAVTNKSDGDIILGSGISHEVKQGSNDNIQTSTSGTVTNSASGKKSYIYTGSTAGTDDLSKLSNSLANLYLSSVGANNQNAQLNTSYIASTATNANTIQNGASTQVMFRENTKFDSLQVNPVTFTKTVGQSDPTAAEFASAMAAANLNGATLSKTGVQNNFKISTDAAGVTGTLPSANGATRSAGTYTYALKANQNLATNVSVTSPATLVMKASSSPIPPVPVVNPSNNGSSSRVKIPTGSANPFQLASAEDLANDICSANSLENCYCEESPLNKGVDICYEPKTAGNGATR